MFERASQGFVKACSGNGWTLPIARYVQAETRILAVEEPDSYYLDPSDNRSARNWLLKPRGLVKV
jgi:hypothetical protein